MLPSVDTLNTLEVNIHAKSIENKPIKLFQFNNIILLLKVPNNKELWSN